MARDIKPSIDMAVEKINSTEIPEGDIDDEETLGEIYLLIHEEDNYGNKMRRNRAPHDEILDDDEELDFSQIKDYEEAIPYPGRDADHMTEGAPLHPNSANVIDGIIISLEGGMERNDWAWVEDAIQRLKRLKDERFAMKEQDNAEPRPPKGPNSADDPKKVEDELIEIVIDVDRYGL